MKIKPDAVHTAADIPECMSVQNIQQAKPQDKHMEQIKVHIICGWQVSRNKITQKLDHMRHSKRIQW